jgi:hypothetical protein
MSDPPSNLVTPEKRTLFLRERQLKETASAPFPGWIAQIAKAACACGLTPAVNQQPTLRHPFWRFTAEYEANLRIVNGF